MAMTLIDLLYDQNSLERMRFGIWSFIIYNYIEMFSNNPHLSDNTYIDAFENV